MSTTLNKQHALNISPFCYIQDFLLEVTYSGRSYIASLIAQAPSMILPLMVLNILGTDNNAYFYVSWTMVYALSTISVSVSQSLFAEGAWSPEKFRKKLINSIKFVFLLLIPSILVIIIAAKWIMMLFGVNYAANSAYSLIYLSLASLPRGLINLYITILKVQSRLKELIIIQLLTATTVIISSALVMRVSGIIGIGYVWLGTNLITAVVIGIRMIARIRQFT